MSKRSLPVPQFPSQKWSRQGPTPPSGSPGAPSGLRSEAGVQDRTRAASELPWSLGYPGAPFLGAFDVALLGALGRGLTVFSWLPDEGIHCLWRLVACRTNCIQVYKTPGMEPSGERNRLGTAESAALIHAHSGRSERGLGAQHGLCQAAGSASVRVACTDGMAQNDPRGGIRLRGIHCPQDRGRGLRNSTEITPRPIQNQSLFNSFGTLRFYQEESSRLVLESL